MAVMFDDLSEEDRSEINSNLHKHFDEVTYDTRHDWLMLYFENDFEYFSNFENINNYLDPVEFESVKLNLFIVGWSLYRVESREKIVLWSKEEYYPNTLGLDASTEIDDGFNSLITFDRSEINMKVFQILETDHLISLLEEDFTELDGIVALQIETYPLFKWSLAKEFIDSIGKVVVQITGTSTMELEHVSNIYNHIKSQLKTDTPILLGVTKNEDFQKTVVETFIYCIKVEKNE